MLGVVVTLYSNYLFEKVLFEQGTANGRTTRLIGLYNDQVDLFVSLYATKSGCNLEFYEAFFKKLNNLVERHKVDNIYISGDLNIELTHARGKSSRKITKKWLSCSSVSVKCLVYHIYSRITLQSTLGVDLVWDLC